MLSCLCIPHVLLATCIVLKLCCLRAAHMATVSSDISKEGLKAME